MNPNEHNKAEEALKKLLSQKSFNVPNTNEENLINMINNMDKTEIITKLNSMGLGFISEKIKNTSNDELIKMLKNNPGLLNKLNNYLR